MAKTKTLSEQLADEALARAAAYQEAGACITYDFARSHLQDPDGGFDDSNPENVALIKDYIRAHKLLWTVESLNEAYAATADRQTHTLPKEI